MRASSRRAYDDAVARLEEVAADATAQQLRAIAEDVLSVAGLLGRELRLRRALADPARSGADRAELLRRLLAGKVGEPAQELLDALVSGRWAAASELLDATEQLGVQALLASAAAAPDVAGEAGVLAEVEDELFRFGQVVAGYAELAAALSDATVPVARRAALVDALLAPRPAKARRGGQKGAAPAPAPGANEVTVRLTKLALGGFGGRTVLAALNRLVELVARRRDRELAYVTVAAPLDEADEQRLGAALAARYGREVSLKTTVDPRVLGGMRVRVGSDLYDGTVARRLADARTVLAHR
jgi:F-type H+-transporting ATPase subunit delta